jgi:anti-anti-sigma factor
MEIRVLESAGAPVVTVSGKLDALSAGDYEEAMNRLFADGKARFVVDFADLTYISSAGLRAILAAAKELNARGGRAAFANVRGNVLNVIEMTGFATILSLHDSVDAALKAL